ncbi:hypothetical protein CDAR_311121 [Caerostris darwini]|uniref:Uncharacterized protein n=1 Tax=Caerostris darwini TaxID=1538125 RepID=A0AAV4WSU0_9ARAC|nr:hypothetical protein CDAR_311121 [Caerostris darwini]
MHKLVTLLSVQTAFLLCSHEECNNDHMENNAQKEYISAELSTFQRLCHRVDLKRFLKVLSDAPLFPAKILVPFEKESFGSHSKLAVATVPFCLQVRDEI